MAYLFGPADYCALMLVGFVCVSFVTTGTAIDVTIRELRRIAAEVLPQKSCAVHQQIVHGALDSVAG